MSRNYLENLSRWLMTMPGRFTDPTKEGLWNKVYEACPVRAQKPTHAEQIAEFKEALRVLGHTARNRQRYDAKGNATKDSYWELPLPEEQVTSG